jgi:hypothetical protein
MRQLALLLIAAVTLSSCQTAPATAVPATAAPTKWEYKEVEISYMTISQTKVRPSVLNELGEEGWEVIQVKVPNYCMSSDGYICAFYLLKRPLPQNRQD